MSQTIDLKELERKAWRSVFQDGLWDIYLGLLLLAMAVGAWLSERGVAKSVQYAVYIGLVVLAMGALWAGKRFITLPRMGRVKFGPKRKRARALVSLILTFSVLVGLVLMLVTVRLKSNPDLAALLSPDLLIPLVWVGNVIIVFGLGAYFLEFKRLYFIGVMYALAIPFDIVLHEFAGIDISYVAFGAPAVAILVVGLVVFVRFLRDYPIPAGPASEGASNAVR
jgi:hypothetical protein